ncbi:unnamed protein product [Clonostachys solani]|uniref:Uncharacterized protein n=1 Tax=Clonostachys solani TaxID=160281 RepID=A0A9P0ECM7_9HYPO|nr:unnamed protein product [Clonostachys solani]
MNAASRRKPQIPSCLMEYTARRHRDVNPRALAPDSPLPTELPKATVTIAHHYQCALELGPEMTEGHVELPHLIQCQDAKPPVIFSDAT